MFYGNINDTYDNCKFKDIYYDDIMDVVCYYYFFLSRG